MNRILLLLTTTLFSIISVFGQEREALLAQLAVERALDRVQFDPDPITKGIVAMYCLDMTQTHQLKEDPRINPILHNAIRAFHAQTYLKEHTKAGNQYAIHWADSAYYQYDGHRPMDDFDETVAVRSIHFDRSGSFFYTAGGDGRLLKWDYVSRLYEEVYRSKQADRVVDISRDEAWLAIGANDNKINIFRLADPSSKPLGLEGHRGAIHDLAFLPGSDGYVSVGNDRKILKGDFESEVEIASVGGPVKTIAVSPDGRLLAGGATDGNVMIYDLESGDLLMSLMRENGDQLPVIDLEFSADGRFLSMGGFHIQTGRGYVQLWETANYVQYGPTLDGFASRVNSIGFSPDSKLILGAGSDKTLRIWKTDEEEIYERPMIFDDHNDWVWDAAFHPTLPEIVTAGADGLVRRYNLNTEMVAYELCTLLPGNLTDAQWKRYFGQQKRAPYQSACNKPR